ncbi:4-phosphoerythronate dehydrogenase PdxB [Saccharicrinis sp. FJH62]|uniref:4-phosphoerythronate dehydrogenase PdxB n=1 Tax=Saccharicrinis sp. FJH62 TaxID=3344657 RepID=UPI0035D4F730
MKIVIDDKIPFIKGVFEPYAEVVYVGGAAFNAEMVRDADALVIRTRTKCNAALLDGSSVRFIATATIGHDHIDKSYCAEKGIKWTNAPGCNSGSVMQYIASVLSVLQLRNGIDVKKQTIGIVGVGNVGSKVEKLCRNIGMNVLLCDPPRQEREVGDFVDFETILENADIITFHVPLDYDSDYPTFHMLNDVSFKKLKKAPVVINSSRGEVVKTESIKKALRDELISKAVLDVWENEPEIDNDLLNEVLIGTPHIAGYSVDGKVNGTTMSVHAISNFFNLPLKSWYPDMVPGAEINELELKGNNIFEVFLQTYDVEIDSDKLKYAPEKFEFFRGSYPVRREFGFFNVKTKNNSEELLTWIKNFGFNV